MEKPLKALGDFLRAQRALVHRSLRDVAEAAKISNAYLSQIERGIYKPSADVLRGLAEALEISKETLYRQAGMLDPSDAVESSYKIVNKFIDASRRFTLGILEAVSPVSDKVFGKKAAVKSAPKSVS